MRLPVGLLVISGMVVCMYLFGLLVAYKHRQVTRIQSEEDQQKQQQEMVQPDSDFYVESRATLTLAKATSDLLRWSSMSTLNNWQWSWEVTGKIDKNPVPMCNAFPWFLIFLARRSSAIENSCEGALCKEARFGCSRIMLWRLGIGMSTASKPSLIPHTRTIHSWTI